MGLDDLFLQLLLFGWLSELSIEGCEPFAVLGVEYPLSTDNILDGWRWGDVGSLQFLPLVGGIPAAKIASLFKNK